MRWKRMEAWKTKKRPQTNGLELLSKVVLINLFNLHIFFEIIPNNLLVSDA